MLRLINFSKSYYYNPVLEINNFKIEQGIYWIRGANGSGKSTLLKSIAGFLHFEGDMMLHEKISLKKNPGLFRRSVSFAQAEPVFPQFLTGREMIKIFKEAKKGTTSQEDFLLDSMGMKSYINAQLGTYSSGMLKKLSLVLAFMGSCEIILLDEPLITLDNYSLQVLNNWIVNRHKQQHTTFLLSSHQPLGISSSKGFVKQLMIERQTISFVA